MNARTIALGLCAAITTFLVVGAVTIELLGAGESPGIGIVGVFVGFVAGLLAGGITAVYADRLSGVWASVLAAYAAFGAAVLAIAGLRYVNVPFADDVFTFPVHIGASLALAVVVAVVTFRRRPGERAASA
ncbi:MAG: permease [Halorubrum sp.]